MQLGCRTRPRTPPSTRSHSTRLPHWCPSLSIYLSIPILPSSSLPSVSACCLRAQIFELLDVDADGVINRKDFNAGMVLLG